MRQAKKAVVFSAPVAWGKTRNAKALMKEFNCTKVVDNWDPLQPMTPGALHLTNIDPSVLRYNKPNLYQLVARGW